MKDVKHPANETTMHTKTSGNPLRLLANSRFARRIALGAVALTFATSGIALAQSSPQQEAPVKECDKGHKGHKGNHKAMRAKLKAMTPEQRKAFHATRMEERLTRMTADLKLTPKQVAKARVVMQAQHKEMAQAHQINKGDRPAMKKARKTIKKTYRAEFEKILTPAQQATHKTVRQAKRKARSEKRLAHMTTKLGLSADQVKKVQAIQADKHTKAQALRKSAKGDRSAVRPQIKALRQDARKKINALLTPEQQATFKTMGKGHKGRKGHGDKGHGHGPF